MEEQNKKASGWKFLGLMLLILIGIGILGVTFFWKDKPEENSSLSGSLTGATINSEGELTILDYQSEYDEYGIKITGTAKNVAGKRLGYAEIDAKFYDKEGTILGNSLISKDGLESEEIWEFEISYLGIDSEKVDHYLLNVGTIW